MDGSRYPIAGKVGMAVGETYGAAYIDPAHTFEFGLQRLLDGIEQSIRARSAGEP